MGEIPTLAPTSRNRKYTQCEAHYKVSLARVLNRSELPRRSLFDNINHRHCKNTNKAANIAANF